MSFEDKRNVLRMGPPEHPGETEITSAMVETVRQRIKDGGGILTVWAVLDEDVYESQFGDGFYLHVKGVALNSADADKLVALAGDAEFTKWHVRSYRLGLKDNAPIFTALWRPAALPSLRTQGLPSFLFFGQTGCACNRLPLGESGGSKCKEAPNEGPFRETLGCLARAGDGAP